MQKEILIDCKNPNDNNSDTYISKVYLLLKQ